MEHESFQFDDAGLKGAVQSAWGSERAPQQLRGRISRLLATAGTLDAASAEPAAPSAWERWQSRLYGLAAAAVIVLAIGLLVLYYYGAFDQAASARYADAGAVMIPTKTDVPAALAESMVITHRTCGKLHDHRFITGVNSYGALNVKLTASLGFPSLARGIGPEWKFQGAGECMVGDLRGSHLMFAHGDQSVSVFSLPAACMSGCSSGAQFEKTVNGAAVAGFARSGAVYAVVGTQANANNGAGSAAMSLETVTAIRNALFGHFDEGCGEALGEPEFFD
jgi:hypothetical protein